MAQTRIRTSLFCLTTLLLLGLIFTNLTEIVSAASQGKNETTINWDETPDQIWLGKELWANPMEDWQVNQHRLECTSRRGNRNVHLLTRELSGKPGNFEVSAVVGLLEKNNGIGAAGFSVAVKSEIEDYRANCLSGSGIECGLQADGILFLGPKRSQKKIEWASSGVQLVVSGEITGEQGSLTLKAIDPESGKTLSSPLKLTVPAKQLKGNIALIHNPFRSMKKKKFGGARFWFDDWSVSGSSVTRDETHSFGPILWAMHTLSDSRRTLGPVLKMTAQLPPLANLENHQIEFRCAKGKVWKQIGDAVSIDPAACVATVRIANWEKWSGGVDLPYQLWLVTEKQGKRIVVDRYEGTVRKDPVDRDLVVAGFTGNTDFGFPNLEVVHNVTVQNPDLLFFSGDQLYENVGGYGIIREPVDRAILNYLRKWYLFGWAFGDLMRDRPAICLPDDHDVYQGNIWGNGGNSVDSIKDHDKGGYAMHRDFVNAVHRTQCSHHPDFYDPTPIKQNISVYYGDMVYGRVSFAIIADRMFKSGPKGVVPWEGRPDHLKDPEFDVKKLDLPGLKLLGDRQLKFLNDWAADWRGADMKCVLSATIFCNLANYHGQNQMYLVADLDSNGWPQTGRNKAVAAMRKGFAFHLAGDQHLASIVHHGIEKPGDSGFSFCVPSIAAGYPRSWRPDQEGKPVRNRPEGGLPNTGDYVDSFGHPITVYAIANPEKKNRPGRINTLHDKASGYGIVRFHKKTAEITMECYRLQIDPNNLKPEDQFPGWPKKIKMQENYGRKAVGYLPTFEILSGENPVIQVINEKTGEIEYTLRIRGNTWQPKVFSLGKYTVRAGYPDRNLWVESKGLQAETENFVTISIQLGK